MPIQVGTGLRHPRAFAYMVVSAVPVLTEMDRLYEQMRTAVVGVPQGRDPFRDIPVKVHIRRPERDTWAYMGRGIVSQEISGQSSRVGAQTSPFSAPPHASLTCLTRPVVRAASSSKILTVFGEARQLPSHSRAH